MRHDEIRRWKGIQRNRRDSLTPDLGTTVALRLRAMLPGSPPYAAWLLPGAGLLSLACGMAPKPLPPTDDTTDSGLPDVIIPDVYVQDTPIDVPIEVATEDATRQPTIDLENLYWWRNPTMDPNQRDKVIGKPGSVDPPTGVVVLTELDSTAPAQIVSVKPDGSFEAAAPLPSCAEYRIQILQGTDRSIPIDLVNDTTHQFIPTVHALAPCLTIEPDLEVPFGPLASAVPFTRSLVIRNACASSVSFLAPRLRTQNADFTLSDLAPFQLAVGEEHTVGVTVNNSNLPMDTQEVLFIEAQSPARDRRPITLFVIP